jgi:hypothetical protein
MKKRIEEINLMIFPFILTIGFFISILESYKYLGFFQKHFYVSSFLVYLLSFINFIILMTSKKLLKELKRKRLLQIFLGFGTIIFFIFILLYVILNEVEVFHYDNFLFATIHIWPGSLIVSVMLSFEAAFLFFNGNRKIKY